MLHNNIYIINPPYSACMYLCAHTCTCCSRALKPVILLENETSQPLHEETGITHITTADSSRCELQPMPKCCKNSFELLASCLPLIMMLQMSNAQFLRKVKFPGWEISPRHLHFESQIGEENPRCSAPSQKSSVRSCYWWSCSEPRVGKITTAEEIVINGCSNCCKKCAHKPLQANVWEQSLNLLDKLSNYTTSSQENLSASERCYWIAHI